MLRKTLLALSLSLLAGVALAKEVTIPTARGDVTLNAPPAKVAVFDAGTLDTLQALGVQVAGAADLENLLPYLKPTTEKAQNVGTLFEPNLEALNELQPDLIIVGMRSAKKLEDVSQIAKAIDLTNSGDKLVEGGLQSLDSLGALFDKQQKAADLRAELSGLLKQTKEAVKGKGKGLIVLVNGGKMSVLGQGDRMSFIHSELGVPMAEANISTSGHGQPISFEFIEKANPDWLFVLDRLAAIGQEGKSAKEVLDNELVRRTNAWKNGNVVYLSSASYLASGGFEQLKTDLTNIKNAFEKK